MEVYTEDGMPNTFLLENTFYFINFRTPSHTYILDPSLIILTRSEIRYTFLFRLIVESLPGPTDYFHLLAGHVLMTLLSS